MFDRKTSFGVCRYLKEFEMVSNKHQEDLNDGKEVNNRLEASTSSFGLQVGRNQRSS